MSNKTANIEIEILTIVEFFQDLFTWVGAQGLPKSYKPDGCVVRYLGDDRVSETGLYDRYDRQYQVVVFGGSELSCLRYIDKVQKKLAGVNSIKLQDSTGYLTIGSFLSSAPFLTEDKIVYAAVGVLHAQVRQTKEIEKYPTVGGVVIRPAGDPTQDDIVVGNDCRLTERGGDMNG